MSSAKKTRGLKSEGFDIASNVLVTVFAVLNLFPLYWLVASSFKSSAAIYKMPPDWIPNPVRLDNYLELFRGQPALRWLANSVAVSLAATLIVVATSSLAAYAFAKLRFKGRDAIFLILVSSIMVPKEVFIVPLFRIMIALRWTDTYWAMIVPTAATCFGVFLLKGFFQSIPDSIRESGKIDGANEIIIFRRLILPIAKPGITALFILNFVNVWNDYLWQLLNASSKDMKTLMVGVASLMVEINPNFGYKMAGATVAAIPMIVIFIAFQRFFTRGITIGAVKE